MDLITRRLVKERDSGFKQYFDFTTYAIVFDNANWPKCPKAQAVFRMLQTQFLAGFKGLPKSPSKMPELMVDVEEIDNGLCRHAKASNYHGAGNRQHSIVQNWFLDNHVDCIATEVPLWYGDVEGCADFLLMQTDPFKLIIPDFKPDARKEKRAATQLIHYAKGLLNLTGGIIQADDIDLVYFDDKHCFKVIR